MQHYGLMAYGLVAVTSGWGTTVTALIMIYQAQGGLLYLNHNTPVVIPLGVLLTLFASTIYTTYKVTKVLDRILKEKLEEEQEKP